MPEEVPSTPIRKLMVANRSEMANRVRCWSSQGRR